MTLEENISFGFPWNLSYFVGFSNFQSVYLYYIFDINIDNFVHRW